MRYFAELAYNGTRYCGWQIQPNAVTIQATIKAAMTTILRTPIFVVGCGRTDTGVHAEHYVMHFDFDGEFPDHCMFRLNHMLGKDIVIKRIAPVEQNAHARYSAYSRSYKYYIDLVKNPFRSETALHYYFPDKLDIVKMQSVADLLLQYEDFKPFSKSHSGVSTYKCYLKRAEWVMNPEEGQLVFHITSNRFLRGMVRMIVGECLNVSTGTMPLEALRDSMDNQTPLKKAYVVPPQGLFLTDIKYPFEW